VSSIERKGCVTCIERKGGWRRTRKYPHVLVSPLYGGQQVAEEQGSACYLLRGGGGGGRGGGGGGGGWGVGGCRGGGGGGGGGAGGGGGGGGFGGGGGGGGLEACGVRAWYCLVFGCVAVWSCRGMWCGVCCSVELQGDVVWCGM